MFLLIFGFFKKIYKLEFEIPIVKFKEVLNLAGYVTAYWMFWNFGFYFFVKSFAVTIPVSAIFLFSFSATLGLLALIVPGGLGVREGLIVVGLTSFGIPLEIATTISIAARLWFISGEVFIFLLALALEKFGLNRNNKKFA